MTHWQRTFSVHTIWQWLKGKSRPLFQTGQKCISDFFHEYFIVANLIWDVLPVSLYRLPGHCLQTGAGLAMLTTLVTGDCDLCLPQSDCMQLSHELSSPTCSLTVTTQTAHGFNWCPPMHIPIVIIFLLSMSIVNQPFNYSSYFYLPMSSYLLIQIRSLWVCGNVENNL